MGQSSEAPEPEHLARAVAGPDDHRHARGAARARLAGTGLSCADDLVGRHDTGAACPAAGPASSRTACRRGRRARCARPWWGRSPPGRSAGRRRGPAGTGARSAASSRSGSWAASQAILAATAPASSGTPVRAGDVVAPHALGQTGAPRRRPAVRPQDARPERVALPPSTGTKVWRAPVHPTTSTGAEAAGAWRAASAQASPPRPTTRSGSCSAQPGSGCAVSSAERGQGHQTVVVPEHDLGDRGARGRP